MTFLDINAPDTSWRPGSEDPIPVLLGRYPATAFAYRFATGRPLDGHARTDATFWHAGTKARTASGHTAPYNYWPGWKRGLLITRLPAFGLVPYTGLVAANEHLEVADGLVWHWAGPAIGWTPLVALGTYAAGRYAVNFQHERKYLRPLRRALVATLRTRDGLKLDIPRGLVHGKDDDAIGRVYLPTTHPLEDGTRDNVMDVIRGRLAHDALDGRWNMEGARPHVELYTPPQPPAEIAWETFLEQASVDSPYLGHTAAGPIHWNLGESSPHIGVVGGTGSGKSELVAAIVAQFMWGGAGVAVLDPKVTSHRWLRGIPGVFYPDTGEGLTHAVLALDAELTRRSKANADADHDLDFPRLVILLEERNSLQDALVGWWKENAPAGRRAERAPAVAALARLGAMGRSLNITLVMAAQETEQRYIGTRSNYGAWAIAGNMGPNHWRTIMGPGGKKPAMSGKPGRFGHVVQGQAAVFQGAYPNLKEETARLIEWATSGDAPYDVRAMMTQQETVTMSRSEPVSSGADTTRFVTLSEYGAAHNLTITKLRNDKARVPGFPEPASTVGTTHRYSEAALDAWYANREVER